MKKFLLSLILAGMAASATAQGTLLFANYVNGVLLAPIYGVDTVNPFVERHGQSPLGLPGGNTVYSGPLLNGSGYSVALYAGPVGSSSSSLRLAATTTFRSSSSGDLPAGLWFSSIVEVPGVGVGERVTVDIRIWDNNGGTITSWEQAVQNGTVARGSTGAFTPWVSSADRRERLPTTSSIRRCS